MSPKVPRPTPVSVSGGSGGITANAQDIFRVAVQFGNASDELRHARRDIVALIDAPLSAGHGLFDDISLGESMQLSQFRALTGSAAQGLQVCDFMCSGIGTGMFRAATGYDELDKHLFGGGLFDVLGDLVHSLGVGAWVYVQTRDLSNAADAAAVDDPELVDDLGNAIGLRYLSSSAGVLSVLIFDDGRGVVRDTGVDTSGAAGHAPRRLTDLLADLDQRNRDQGGGGLIDVRILTLPDGTRKAVVDITGTKSWNPVPSRNVADLTTDELALAGVRTAYEAGVLAAMRKAGVRRGDDVMLVGHSQGGLIAVNAARRATRSGEFHITHVVTAGAPIGRLVGGLPTGVKVLALENKHDIVPHLDGRENPDRRNVTTVTTNRGDRTVLGNHGLPKGYDPAAADAQASHHKSVRDFLNGARGYFGATQVTTHTFQIERR